MNIVSENIVIDYKQQLQKYYESILIFDKHNFSEKDLKNASFVFLKKWLFLYKYCNIDGNIVSYNKNIPVVNLNFIIFAEKFT